MAITVNLYYTGRNGSARKFAEHHKTPMMQKVIELREKYDLHMRIERYRSDDQIPDRDKAFIRK